MKIKREKEGSILKEREGFTLIELLAVIVVLAIVTVLATRSILPFMSNAARDAFASEANIAINGASDAMSLKAIGSIDNSDYTEVKDSNGNVTAYCFTLDDLKKLGLWSKDDSNYAGTVTVTPNGNQYTYSVEMHNKDYYVQTTSGQIKSEDKSADVPNGVGEYDSSVTLKTACK